MYLSLLALESIVSGHVDIVVSQRESDKKGLFHPKGWAWYSIRDR